MALGEGLIDAAGFTSVRLLSGALVLTLIYLASSKQKNQIKSLLTPGKKQLVGAVCLFIYATSFSFAYLVLDTGTGALVLFGAVQLSILFSRLFTGERFVVVEWFGVLLSFAGLVYLLIPAWGTPSLLGFALMTFSGLAWGLYTLAGQGSKQALFETSKNFIWCVPLVLVLNLIVFQPSNWTSEGFMLALLSGALTSGIGYAIWYAILPKLSSSQAGVLQLLVPVLAAFGGVLFTGETMSPRLIISTTVVLTGIYLVINSAKKNLNAR